MTGPDAHHRDVAETHVPFDFDAVAQVPEHAQCLGCGYALRGLGRPVCPECGRAFIPSDTTTFRNPNLVPRWREIAKPPGPLECAAALFIAAVALVGASQPPPVTRQETGSMVYTLAVFLLGAPVFWALFWLWCARIIATLVAREPSAVQGPETRARRPFRWLALPLAIALVVSTLLDPWPLRLRFYASRSSFDAAVAAVRAGSFSTPTWVGLYRVESAKSYSKRDGGLEIEFETNWMEGFGFMYADTPAPLEYGWDMMLAPNWCIYKDGY